MRCAGCRREFSAYEALLIEITKNRDADATSATVLGRETSRRVFHPHCTP